MRENRIAGMQQEADTASKVFFGNNKNFAEVFNKLLFNEVLIDPEKLEDSDTTESAVIEISEGKRITLQKYRDLKKKYYENVGLWILAIENQTHIHYLEPLVIMGYDYIDYMKQVNNIGMEYKNKSEKLSGDEYLSRFKKGEKLTPIISIVVYYGDKEWDGPTKLSDLFPEMKSSLYKYVNDYPLHIIDVQRMTEEEINSLSGEVKAVLGFIRYSAHTEELRAFIDKNESQFENVSIEAAKMIDAVSKNYRLSERIEKAAKSEIGGVNMCKALEDWERTAKDEGIREGKEEGIKEGKKEGIREEKTAVILRMKKGGLTDEQTAFFADCSINEVRSVYEAAGV